MNGSLYLFPDDPNSAPDTQRILDLLCELEITGGALHQDATKQVYEAGPGFARQVIFAGCSPHLRFEPEREGDRDFCHVALIGPLDRPLLLAGAQTGKPRCPYCRARLDDWRERITTAETETHCPSCGQTVAAATLDWRQQAAIGRVLLELRNVFPGEATPGDGLSSGLAQATGMAWRHAWADMSPLP